MPTKKETAAQKKETVKLAYNLQLLAWTSGMFSGETFYGEKTSKLSYLDRMTGGMFGEVKVRL